MEKFCQSCMIPLNQKELDNRGTEKDGSKSNEYCNLCYSNGEFIDPNITYEEILQRGIKGIEQSEGSKIKKWFMIKSYPSMLKKAKRWQ